MEFTVNGNRLKLEARPGEMLSDLLRERLGLTGTKIGCNEAECGACTVLVNGEPVLSCNFPSAKAAGKQIITIEGLADLVSAETPSPDTGRKLHPLQEAFIQHGAVQCGFCIPGQIMTAYALLQRDPDPGEEEIRGALKDTLCRCAGYPTIVSSINAAAKSLREQKEVVAPQSTPSSNPMKVVGRHQIRPDAEAKVTGAAVYSDDIKFPGMLHARVKRAGVPHAFLRSLDVSQARQLRGVEAVLTAADIPGQNNHGLVVFDWPVLVDVGERVRYVGDAVAIVAAETREIASQALDLIEAAYDLHRLAYRKQPNSILPATCSNTSRSEKGISRLDFRTLISCRNTLSIRRLPTMLSWSQNAV